LERRSKHWAGVRDMDQGPSGGRAAAAVDSNSWPLAGWSRGPLFKREILPWLFARVGGRERPKLIGSAERISPACEQQFVLDLKQAGFDRVGTTKSPQQAC
jgi:hypothetical protein